MSIELFAYSKLTRTCCEDLIEINLGSCHDSGLVEAALKSYKQALALRPEFPEATCNLLHTLQVYLGVVFKLLVILVPILVFKKRKRKLMH